jgi:hypothetical protein
MKKVGSQLSGTSFTPFINVMCMASFSHVENLFSVSTCAELSIECAKLLSVTSAELLWQLLMCRALFSIVLCSKNFS